MGPNRDKALRPPLSWTQRVRVWDAALAAVRSTLRGAGLLEVTTPVWIRAAAVEPFIEPIPVGPGYLATSPELAMKRLLCRGAPAIFQISPCFRAAERGDLHREEFHLIEWYRREPDETSVQADVERVLAAVLEAVAEVLDEPAVVGPRAWIRVGFLDLVEQTTDLRLRGDEDAEGLRAAVAAVSPAHGLALGEMDDVRLAEHPRAHALAAWTSLFSVWSDRHLEPWLGAHPDQGVHVVEFPPALAALSVCGPGSTTPERDVAYRFESHVQGLELANGYRELQDPEIQRQRFEDVNHLRAAYGRPPLPIDGGFISELDDPGLPPASGVALGLERLVLVATGRRRMDDIELGLGSAQKN